jgi:hypothetical protein
MGLHKLGSVGLLLIVTALLAVSTIPGAVGGVVGYDGISPQQGPATVTVTVHDCAGNPVRNAAIQIQSLPPTWDQWTYTNSNGVAILSAPPGTYTLQGGYGTFKFSQTINFGTGGVTVTGSLGAGCNSFSSSTQTQYYTPIRPIRTR